MGLVGAYGSTTSNACRATVERGCSQQKTQQRRAIYVAQQARNDRKIKEAYEMPLPSCKELNRIRKGRGDPLRW